MKISAKEARKLALMGQGLLHRAHFGHGKEAVQKAVEQLLYVQIDTISVVERAHHHVLHTRIKNYKPEMLHELQSKDSTLFEYWSHAAAFLPTKDYRFYLPIMHGRREKKKVDAKWKKKVLTRLKNEGPLQSKNFENLPGKKTTGWWDWKPAKVAMENMFLSGELLIKERKGFQKVYDLAENVIPSHIDMRFPSDSERGQFYVRGMLNALGIASAKQIGYNRGSVKRLSGHNIQSSIDSELENFVESGEVTKIQLVDHDYYCHSNLLNRLPVRLGKKQIKFLSPFDNLVINRERLSQLFDFDYILECYVPGPKRKHGYFTLPILYGDALVGRLDCKANRKQAILEVNNIWLEEETKMTDGFITSLRKGLQEYCLSLGCDELCIRQTDNKKLKQALDT
jgi:uncharacterized protein YcaQ